MKKSFEDVFQTKDYAFFISAGRTGTKYFGDVCSGIISDCHLVHEPDVINLSIYECY